MGRQAISSGAVVTCDAPSCPARFVTYSVPAVAREQAQKTAGWARVSSIFVEEHGRRDRASDVCPTHKETAEAKKEARPTPAKAKAQREAEREAVRQARATDRATAKATKKAAVAAMRERARDAKPERLGHRGPLASDPTIDVVAIVQPDKEAPDHEPNPPRAPEANPERSDDLSEETRRGPAMAAPEQEEAGTPPREPRAPRAPRRVGPSVLDTVAIVLAEAQAAGDGACLTAAEIVEAAKGRLPTASKTPNTIVSRDLALDVKNLGDASRFVRTSPGRFRLRS